MTTDPTEALNELADAVTEEFAEYRPADDFRVVNPVVENEDSDHPTLIVHIDREDASSLADEVEQFLQSQGARTEREAHSEVDVRVLATVE